MIAAVDPNGVIGVDNRIPWHHSADLKRFKRLTVGHTVIMGRNTFESIGRPLPKRKNIVVTRQDFPNVVCVRSLGEALAAAEGDAWLIGGRAIYEAGMDVADVIDLTLVPDLVPARPGVVHFPPIDEARFEPGPVEALADDPRLGHQIWRRRG
jgi:dihydrofolate reductase